MWVPAVGDADVAYNLSARLVIPVPPKDRVDMERPFSGKIDVRMVRCQYPCLANWRVFDS